MIVQKAPENDAIQHTVFLPLNGSSIQFSHRVQMKRMGMSKTGIVKIETNSAKKRSTQKADQTVQ